jgi:hypothetical protein
LLIALRRPRKWAKTEKTGFVSDRSLDIFTVLPENPSQVKVSECPDN